jgi:CheY-like chemotaxis protein
LLGHPITVVSKVGRGSKFSIEVPLARTEEAQGKPIDPLSPWDENVLIGACVLVIDDEPEILEAIEALLKQWGCRVLAVDSSHLALELLRTQDLLPDVILSDYRLRAGQSGIEAIRSITREFGAIPAALITGDTASDSLKEAAISHYELMHKPLNPARLKGVLCRMLQRDLAALPRE